MEAQRVSIIIEWENVLLSEMGRCRAMLQELRRQINELDGRRAKSPGILAWLTFPFEVMIVFDPDKVPAAHVHSELARVFPAADSTVEPSLAPAAGLGYFGLKNFGARRAAGGVLLFLDSDVIPEAEWLEKLLGVLDDPEKQVVGGDAYIDPATLLGRAFALTWYFPVRSEQASLLKAPRFHANNVAFRKEIFLRFPFPKLDGADRGACGRLAVTLARNEIGIYRHHGARVSHPPPNGLRHLVLRALAHGRDDVLGGRAASGRSWSLRETWRQIRYCFASVGRGLISIARNRSKVNLTLAETPLAAGIAIGYFHLRLLGALMTQIHPRYMRNHFRI